MARLLELDRWLIEACVPRGFRVVVVDGFRQRGSETFTPRAGVAHHTAGRCPRGSYQIVIHGRTGLPGPLCHVYIDCEGTIYVVAAGRANHAGTGQYRELSGNTYFFGIEPEHIGSASVPWPPKQMAAYILVMAVVMKKLGRDGSWVCAHREYATPPGRKSDPAGIDMNWFRAQITAKQRELDGPAVPPPPLLVPEEDDEMKIVFNVTWPGVAPHGKVIAGKGHWYVAPVTVDGRQKSVWLSSVALKDYLRSTFDLKENAGAGADIFRIFPPADGPHFEEYGNL